MKPDNVEFVSGGRELLPEYLPLWTAAFGDTEHEAEAILSASGAERDIFLLRQGGEAVAGACAMSLTMTGAARGSAACDAKSASALPITAGAITAGADGEYDANAVNASVRGDAVFDNNKALARGSYLYAMTVRSDMRGRGFFRVFCRSILALLEERGGAFALLVPARPELFAMYRSLGFDREAAGLVPEFGAPPLVISADDYASLPIVPFDGDTAQLAAIANLDDKISRAMLDGDAYLAAADEYNISYLCDDNGIFGYIVAENNEYSVNIYDFSFHSGRGGYIINKIAEMRNRIAIRPKALWRDFTGAGTGGRELFADILFEG